MKLFYHDTTIGRIGIAENADCISNLYFATDATLLNVELQETSVIKEAFRQLESYLAGDLKIFTIPLAPYGTDFMRSVWIILRDIPYGKTASYKEIASAVGNPKAMRAVGMANNRNPIPIFIPCHRIIGSDGKLVGYRGGLELKRELLELEKQ